MDAVIGDVMDAKTTDKMTSGKDAEIFETETRVPTMTGGVPPHHFDSSRVCVTRSTCAVNSPARTRRGLSSDHVMGYRPGISGRSLWTDPTETTDTPTAEIASTAVRMVTGQLNAQTKQGLAGRQG